MTGLRLRIDASAFTDLIARAKEVVTADESRLDELLALFDDGDLFAPASYSKGVVTLAPSRRFLDWLGQSAS